MTETPERPSMTEPDEGSRDSMAEAAGQRGEDDRRHDVRPVDNPVPQSPAPDEEAIRKGEETLDRIKPY